VYWAFHVETKADKPSIVYNGKIKTASLSTQSCISVFFQSTSDELIQLDEVQQTPHYAEEILNPILLVLR